MTMLRRILSIALIWLAACQPVTAQLLGAGQNETILFSGQSQHLYGAGDGYFSRGSCWTASTGYIPCPQFLVTTRASTGYAQTAAGALVPFAANTPRITDLGLLVEQASTNLALQSQTFDSSSTWTVTNTSITANQTTAPDATLTADLLAADGTANQHYIVQSGLAVSGTQYAVSVYVKAGTANFFQITVTGGNVYSQWNLATGAVANSSAGTGTLTSNPAGSLLINGWWRFTMTFTQSAGTTQAVRFYTLNAAIASPGPSETSTASLSLWGAQLEALAFPTSYIPTTTSTVARAADIIKIAPGPAAPILTSSKISGWIYTKGNSAQTTGSSGGLVAINDNTSNNRIDLRSNQSTLVTSFITAAGTGEAFIGTGSAVANAAFTSAITWQVGNAAISHDGATAVIGTPAALPTAQTQILIGSFDASSSQLNNYIKRVVLGTQYLGASGVQALSGK